MSGEQIVVLFLVRRGSNGELFNSFLHFIESFLRDYGRNAVLNDNARMIVFAYVRPAAEHIQHGGVAYWLAAGATYLFFFEIVVNFFGSLAACAHIEDEPNNRRGFLVDCQPMVNDFIAERDSAAVLFAFKSIFTEAALNVLRKVGGVVFRHALNHRFQDYALGSVGDILLDGDKTHAIFAQSVAVESRIIAVSGEPVQLPDEDDVEQLFCAVGNHTLKVGAVVCFSRESSVYIFADDFYSVVFSVSPAISDLPFDTLFSLIIARIPSVNYCFHYFINLRQNGVYVLFCSSC